MRHMIFIFLFVTQVLTAQEKKMIFFGVESGAGYQYDARYFAFPGLYTERGRHGFALGPTLAYFRNEPRPGTGAWLSYRNLVRRQRSNCRLFFEFGLNYLQGVANSDNYYPFDRVFYTFFGEPFTHLNNYKVRYTIVQALPGFGALINFGKMVSMRVTYAHGFSADYIMNEFSNSAYSNLSFRRNIFKVSLAWRLFSVKNPDEQQLNRLSTGS
jgi:hypothetical protein